MQGQCEFKYKCFTVFYLGVWLCTDLSPSAAVWAVTTTMSKEQSLDSPEPEKRCSVVSCLNSSPPAALWGEGELMFDLFPVERAVVWLLIVYVISQSHQFPSVTYQAGEQHEALALENPVLLRHCQPLCTPWKANGTDLQQQQKEHNYWGF